MSTTHTSQSSNIRYWASRVTMIISGTLLFSGAIELINPLRADGFPKLEQRGPNGAAHLMNKTRSQLPRLKSMPEPVVQAPIAQSSHKVIKRFPILIQQGPHGAYRILSQTGVGGPQGGEYKGFPKLEQRGPHGAYRIIND